MNHTYNIYYLNPESGITCLKPNFVSINIHMVNFNINLHTLEYDCTQKGPFNEIVK